VLVRQTKMKGASYVHKVQRLQWQLELAFPVLGTLIVVVAGAVPMAMLAVDKTVADNRWQMYGLALAHYIGLASTIFLIGLVRCSPSSAMWLTPPRKVIVPVLLKPVIKDLNEVVSADIPMSPHAGASGRSDQVRTVLRKFDVFLAQLRHESILNLGLAVLMGLWPLLQMASSYFLPIACALAPRPRAPLGPLTRRHCRDVQLPRDDHGAAHQHSRAPGRLVDVGERAHGAQERRPPFELCRRPVQLPVRHRGRYISRITKAGHCAR